MWKITPAAPLYLGVQSGLYMSFYSTVGASAVIFMIPVMGSMYYRFAVPQSNIHPYMGMSIGMDIAIASASAGTYSASGVGAGFAFLARPGIEFPIGSGSTLLAIEPKFGIIGSTFVFLPHAGFIFNL